MSTSKSNKENCADDTDSHDSMLSDISDDKIQLKKHKQFNCTIASDQYKFHHL